MSEHFVTIVEYNRKNLIKFVWNIHNRVNESLAKKCNISNSQNISMNSTRNAQPVRATGGPGVANVGPRGPVSRGPAPVSRPAAAPAVARAAPVAARPAPSAAVAQAA